MIVTIRSGAPGEVADRVVELAHGLGLTVYYPVIDEISSGWASEDESRRSRGVVDERAFKRFWLVLTLFLRRPLLRPHRLRPVAVPDGLGGFEAESATMVSGC